MTSIKYKEYQAMTLANLDTAETKDVTGRLDHIWTVNLRVLAMTTQLQQHKLVRVRNKQLWGWYNILWIDGRTVGYQHIETGKHFAADISLFEDYMV